MKSAAAVNFYLFGFNQNPFKVDDGAVVENIKFYSSILDATQKLQLVSNYQFDVNIKNKQTIGFFRGRLSNNILSYTVNLKFGVAMR